MGIDAERAPAPDRLQPALREVFAEEIAERLPRIEARDDLEAVRRDAHTLGSSGWVVGEPAIARLARAVEHDVVDGPYDELIAALRAWTP